MVFKKSETPKGPGRPKNIPVVYAVTFESETLPPITLTGTVCASNPHRIAYLATREARKQAKGIRWSSLVVLISKTGPVGPSEAR